MTHVPTRRRPAAPRPLRPPPRVRWLLLLSLLLPSLAACRAERVTDARDGGPSFGQPGPDVRLGQPLSGDQSADRAHLARLEERAKAIATTTGCATASACAAAPVGAKACGGPRYYLPYCPLGTDVGALTATLADIERFERAFNERYGLASTCEFVMPPTLELAAGACRAVVP